MAGTLPGAGGGVSAQRIATEPAFETRRKHMAEFKRAAAASKLLRNSLAAFMEKASDPWVSGRLTGAMVKVIQTDTANPPGQRNVIHAKIELLKGFYFNAHGKLNSTLLARFTATINRHSGLHLKILLANCWQKKKSPVGDFNK